MGGGGAQDFCIVVKKWPRIDKNKCRNHHGFSFRYVTRIQNLHKYCKARQC